MAHTLRCIALQGISARVPPLLEAEAAWTQSHASVPEDELPLPVNAADAELAYMRGFRRRTGMGPLWPEGAMTKAMVRIQASISSL